MILVCAALINNKKEEMRSLLIFFSISRISWNTWKKYVNDLLLSVIKKMFESMQKRNVYIYTYTG